MKLFQKPMLRRCLHASLFLFILTAEIQTFRTFQYPTIMKKHAQAILLFTGYPLEPIVALQVKKSYQSHLADMFGTLENNAAQPLKPVTFKSASKGVRRFYKKGKN
jgi:hypothetical protein